MLALDVSRCQHGDAQQLDSHPGNPPGENDSGRMEQRMDQLLAAVDSMRQQLNQSQHEMEQMRAELQAMREHLAQTRSGEEPTQAAAALQSSVQQLQEQTDVLQAEVKQHDQTKLESLSKYPVRISGMLLFTSQLNGSNVDDIDVPIIARPTYSNQPRQSQQTARQTILTRIDRAITLGSSLFSDISVDFFGAFHIPITPLADFATTHSSRES